VTRRNSGPALPARPLCSELLDELRRDAATPCTRTAPTWYSITCTSSAHDAAELFLRSAPLQMPNAWCAITDNASAISLHQHLSGDLLLKIRGHAPRRVIFYDYDELCRSRLHFATCRRPRHEDEMRRSCSTS